MPNENPAFSTLRFSGGGGYGTALAERTLTHIAGVSSPRVLDLGCGSGGLAIAIAQARPDASVVALDISQANVSIARSAADASGAGGRIETICTDYMNWRGGPFDAVVCDSVLYLIAGDDDVLAKRLSSDLRPGGVLVASFPVESSMNALRLSIRRLWKMLPPAMDRLPLAIARRAYPNFSDEALADRVKYLRVTAVRLYGERIKAVFAQHGLDIVEESQAPNASIAKLAHAIVVWRRR